MLFSHVSGNDHILDNGHNEGSTSVLPFAIGDINPDGEFIHVFDEFTLDLLIKELDTIVDFTSYLAKRELLFRNKKKIVIPGEEELLALYLTSINDQGERDFILNGQSILDLDVDGVVLERDFFSTLKRNCQYKEKKKANTISYLWDKLITRFTTKILNGTIKTIDGLYIPSEMEVPVRKIALENRFYRRILSKGISGVHHSATNISYIYHRIMLPDGNVSNGTVYIYVIYPQKGNLSVEEYIEFREQRKTYVHAYLICFLNEYHDKYKTVVAIAVDHHQAKNIKFSEDMFLVEISEWTDQNQKYADEIKDILKPFKSRTVNIFHEDEYPAASRGAQKMAQLKHKRRRFRKKSQ